MRNTIFYFFVIQCFYFNVNGQGKESSLYKCIPCNLQCDTIKYEQPGVCPHCQMELILNKNRAQSKITYGNLQDYEGEYQYLGNTTLTLVASEMDTILYAVIDQAKYPLKYIAVDTFTNVHNDLITFHRENGKIKNYKVDGKTFEFIGIGPKKLEMFPRREFYHKPESYSYAIPEKTRDGLAVGNVKDVFDHP